MSDGNRFLVEKDGQRHLQVMKGLLLSPRDLLLVLIGFVILFLIPDIAEYTPLSFRTFHKGLLFGIAALGLSLLLRHTQLVSFGHAAFFGTGAYTAAVFASHYDVVHGSVLVLLAILMSTLMALVVGYLVAEHLDIYFALLTLAFNGVLFALVLGSGFFNYNDGLAVRPGDAGRPLIAGMELSPDVFSVLTYYASIVFLVVLLLFTFKLSNSPFGRALDAIGQDRTRAEFIGINVSRSIWILFTLTGIYGGVAGGLFALMELHVRPEPTLFIFVSGEILFMAILGGFNTILGPIVGGIIITYALDLARFYTEYHHALAGIMFLLIVYFLPEGVMGSTGDIKSGLNEVRNDPKIIGTWVGQLGPRIREQARQSIKSAKQLLGVR